MKIHGLTRSGTPPAPLCKKEGRREKFFYTPSLVKRGKGELGLPVRLRRTQTGQGMIEYMLIVAGVVVVLILALGPGGFVTRGIGKAINILMVNRIIDTSPGTVTGCGANCSSSCTGSGFPKALVCSGDETGVGAPTARTLVPACTDDGTDARSASGHAILRAITFFIAVSAA